jgi:hypothetical protein
MKTRKLLLRQVVLALSVYGSSFGQETVGLQPSADKMTRVLESIASNQISVRARAKARTRGASRMEGLKRVGAMVLQAAEERVARQAPVLWQEAYTQAMPSGLSSSGGPTYNAPSANAFSAGQFGRLRSADGTVSIVAPSDWRPGPALEDALQAYGPRGESFSYGKLDVYMNCLRQSIRGGIDSCGDMNKRRAAAKLSRVSKEPILWNFSYAIPTPARMRPKSTMTLFSSGGVAQLSQDHPILVLVESECCNRKRYSLQIMATPPRMVELRCPQCRVSHWEIDFDYRGAALVGKAELSYPDREHFCPTARERDQVMLFSRNLHRSFAFSHIGCTR